MAESYKTVTKESSGLYKEKGSRFVSFVYPVGTEEEIKNIIRDLKRKYHDARHICYAWVLDAEKNQYRINDDGEPQGTAGRPILAQLQKYGLSNVLLAVVRYFGGTLLGRAGLANAYRASAADAISKAEVITKDIESTIRISFPYEQTNVVLSVIKELGIKPRFAQNDQKNSVEIRVAVKKQDELVRKMSIFKQVKIEYLNNIN